MRRVLQSRSKGKESTISTEYLIGTKPRPTEQQMAVRNATVCLAAIGLICFSVAIGLRAVPTAVEAISSVDSKHYVIIAPCITSVGTFAAVYVAYLVLRFNHRSQANPLRIELYKRQVEVIAKLIAYTNRMGLAIARGDDIQLRKTHERSSIFKDNSTWLLPESVSTAYAETAKLLLTLLTRIEGSERLEQHKIYDEVNVSYNRFINACRAIAGTDPLTADVLEIMHRKTAEKVIESTKQAYRRRGSNRPE